MRLTARLTTCLATFLALTIFSGASAQITIDNFSDGLPMPLWVPSDPPNDGVSLAEQNSRLEFTLTPVPPGVGVTVAGYQPNAWGLSTKADFRAKVQMHFLTALPAHTYAAVLVNASVIGRPRLANGLYEGSFASFGSFFDGSVGPNGSSKRFFAVERVQLNGATTGVALFTTEPASTLFVNQQGLPAFTATETITLFMRYATVSDTLFVSVVGYNDPNAVVVTNATGGTRLPLQLFLAARAQQPKAQGPNNTWLDELVLDQGSMVHSKTPTILWRNPNTGGYAMWIVTPSGGVASAGNFTPLAPSTGWRQVGIGDFNGDGRTDIFWRNEITGTNYIWYLAGSTLIGGATPPGVPVGVGWVAKGVGDFNRDGYADVIWHQQNTGEYQMWLMQGGTIIGGGTVGMPAPEWQLQAIGDMNKDGRDDLVWRNVNSGVNYVWYMNGVSMIGGATLPALSTTLGWELVGAIDINRDGQDDLVWRHAATSQTVVWVMNGLTVPTTMGLPPTTAPWVISGSQ